MRLTVEVSSHERRGRSWSVITAYGINQGRYGSLWAVTVDHGEERPPGDPEELVAVLMSGLHAAVYHL